MAILTLQQQEILSALRARQGETVTTKDLIDALWEAAGRPGDPSNVIKVRICQLRQHLAGEGQFRINTIWGRGYQLVANRQDNA
jgi:DNA-binding winged helix-turn-helix (wHTH) protein